MKAITVVLEYLALGITLTTLALAGLLLLRMFLQWAQVNPFSWFSLNLRRVTEPFMRPFRYGFDNRTLRFDFLPIVAAVFTLFTGLFTAGIVNEVAGIFDEMSKFAPTVGRVLSWVVGSFIIVYLSALLARFLMPFAGIGYSNRFFRMAYWVTEPVLKPLRRYLVFGPVDASPIVVILVLQFFGLALRNFLFRL